MCSFVSAACSGLGHGAAQLQKIKPAVPQVAQALPGFFLSTSFLSDHNGSWRTWKPATSLRSQAFLGSRHDAGAFGLYVGPVSRLYSPLRLIFNWTLAVGKRTFSGAGRQQGARIVLGGAQFLGAQQRVEFDCSVGSNTFAAAPQLALCIPAGMSPRVSKRRS